MKEQEIRTCQHHGETIFAARSDGRGGIRWRCLKCETEAAGERILAMVHEVLGTDKCKTYLDFRPSEPTWIQFKFHRDEFDIEKLDSITRDSGIITKDIIKQCAYGRSY